MSLLVTGVTIETAWGMGVINAAAGVARSKRRKNTTFVCIDLLIDTMCRNGGSVGVLLLRLFLWWKS
jgi:hypothetical protein